MPYDYDIGIIGAGAAGLSAAAGAARFGARTLLLEKEKMGGDCLHFGCVPSKTLIKCASVYHAMKTASRYGLPSVEAPPVDFGAVSRRIEEVVEKIQEHDSAERFQSLGVDVVFGSARFSDEHRVEVSGKRLSAKNWLIATGSSPLVPPIPGLSEVPFLTNRDLFSLSKLPASLAILGAGPIGIEMAQAFARLGSKVSVIEMGGQILPAEDPDMALIVMDRLRAEGVDFIMGAKAVSVERADGGVAVNLENADKTPGRVMAESLLVAVGRSPNTEGLGLSRLAISSTRGGITVDGHLRTDRANIYAAGDCKAGLKFTHVAGYDASIFLTNSVLHLPRKSDYTRIPWCTYTDPELASVGLNEKRAKSANEKFSVIVEEFSSNDRFLAEGAASGRIKLILGEQSRVLGVQIAGPHAGEILSGWVVALAGNVGLAKMAGAVFPYPTLSEIDKKVSGKVFEPKIFSDTVKKTLRLLFRYKGQGPG